MPSTQRIVVLEQTQPVPASVRSWPEASRSAANQILARYGPPHQANDSQLIWHWNSPWKKTVVYRQGTPHSFPKPHMDVLEQTVEYRVPPAALSALAAFNGSVVVNLAKQEMSVHCDSEEMNRMIINLAHDIITHQHSAQEAQRMLQHMATALRFNWPEEYAEHLFFDWHEGFAESQRRRPARYGPGGTARH